MSQIDTTAQIVHDCQCPGATAYGIYRGFLWHEWINYYCFIPIEIPVFEVAERTGGEALINGHESGEGKVQCILGPSTLTELRALIDRFWENLMP